MAAGKLFLRGTGVDSVRGDWVGERCPGAGTGTGTPRDGSTSVGRFSQISLGGGSSRGESLKGRWLGVGRGSGI